MRLFIVSTSPPVRFRADRGLFSKSEQARSLTGLNDSRVDKRLEPHSHFVSRPMQSTANGSDRQPEHPSDFLVLQPVDFLEHQRDPEHFRYAGQGVFDHPPSFLGFEVPSRVAEDRKSVV